MKLLKTLDTFNKSLIQKLYEFNRITLSITMFLICILLLFFKPLELHITIDQLINKDFQSSKDYFNLKEEFSLGKTSSVIFEKQVSEFTQNDLCGIRLLTQEVTLKNPAITNSFSLFYLRRTYYSDSNTTPILNFPYVLQLNCNTTVNTPMRLESFNDVPWRELLISKAKHSFIHQFDLESSSDPEFEITTVPKVAETLENSFSIFQNKINRHWFGDITYQKYFKEGLDYNNLLNILIIIVIGLIFKYFYGTFVSSFIFLISLAISCTILFSLMSLFHVPIDILNNSLILLLTVSSLGDFVFLSSKELNNKSHWLDSFKEISTPSFFTSLTTFIGFISLCSSDIEVVRRLGLWGGISGVIEWFTVMLLLPAIIKTFFSDKTWVIKNPRKHFVKIEDALSWFTTKRTSRVLLFLILTIPFSIKYLNVNDQPDKLFKPGNHFRSSIEFLSQHFNYKGDVSLVFYNKKSEQENISKLNLIRNYYLVSRIDNPYESLAYFTNPIPEKYKGSVNESLKDTLQFKRLFSQDKTRAVLYLKNIDMKEVEKLRLYVRDNLCLDQSCYLSGSLIAYADFSQKVPGTLINSFLISIILVIGVIVFLAFSTGNKKHVFKLAFTSIWGVAVTLLLISLFQIEMNFVTCVVISILVGMTGDNTIQYILAGVHSNIEEGISERSDASIINTLTMVSCSFVFLLYYFEPPKTFGILLIIGLVSSLFGDYWILKSLFKKRDS